MLDGKFEISNSHDLETLRFHANGSPLLNQKIKIIVQENILNVEHLFDILTLVKKSGAHHLKLDFSQMSSPSMNEDLINLLIQQISKLNELQKLSIKHGKLNLTQATLLVEALPKNITSLDFNYHHFDLRNERDTRDFFKALSNSSIDDFTFGQTLVSDDNLSAIAANLSLFSRQFHFTLRPGNRITKMGYEILYNIKKHNPYIFASIKDKLSRSDSHFSNSPLPNVPSLFLLLVMIVYWECL